MAREMAAVLACRGGVISFRTAAVLLQLLAAHNTPEIVDVTVSTGTYGRVRRGIRAHRNVFASDEIMRLDGLPVTTPARTLLDLASVSTELAHRALATAEHQDDAVRTQVMKLLDRYPRCRGSHTLRELIKDPSVQFTRSDAEDLFAGMIKAAGLPKPETNVRLCGFEVDCYWRAARLVVEIDGYEYHGSKRAFMRDRRRDSALAAAGIRVIRLSWAQLTAARDRTLVELALALARPTT
jgi:very-short-patch-repair endonuclease